jgi:hypothetical protein
MPSNKLTQVALRAAMPRDKPYKLGDGDQQHSEFG